MKETTFYIILNIKTSTGYETIGKFYIGNDNNIARSIFHQLKGRQEVDETSVMTLELMETRHGLPVNLQLLSCGLDELAENCRVIVREAFKLFTLEES